MSTKDPAFLFYSKDFYEGTRMMLPEERACYIDLMIYQHQNGIIPNDLKRVLMYCSGIDEATLKATLKAKFKLCDNGWFNNKLKEVSELRESYTNKQSINGSIGQFWKKCKALLSTKEYKELRKKLKDADKDSIHAFLKNKNLNKATLKATLEALLQHLVNANENENVIVNKSINKIEVKDEVIVKEKIEFQKIVDIFNSVCKNLPSVQKITNQRKSSINSRMNDYGLEKIGEVFQIVSKNEFLNGGNDRGWKADFDWVMNPNNFIKILEGKYQNNGKQTNKTNEEVFKSGMESEVGKSFKFK